MKFKQRTSPQLRRVIKACTTREQRENVANNHKFSIHTLNSLIEGNKNILDSNRYCISELLEIAIQNANKMGISLMKYYEEVKPKEN